MTGSTGPIPLGNRGTCGYDDYDGYFVILKEWEFQTRAQGAAMQPEINECPVETSLLAYYASLPDAHVVVMEPFEDENENHESWLRIKFKDASKPAYIRFPRHTIFVNREREA